jgi:copper chaperone CopZ
MEVKTKVKALNGKHVAIVFVIFGLQLSFFTYLNFRNSCSDEDDYNPDGDTFSLSSIVCEKCADRIQDSLKNYIGIIESKIDLINKEALVKYDPNVLCKDKIDSFISSLGYNADNLLADKSAFDKLEECCKVKEPLEICIQKYNLTDAKSCCGDKR